MWMISEQIIHIPECGWLSSNVDDIHQMWMIIIHILILDIENPPVKSSWQEHNVVLRFSVVVQQTY